MNEKSDEILVSEVQEGSIESFEILVRKYQDKLLYYAIRFVGNKDSAEEIVQDSFLNVYKSIGNIDISKKFSSYLYRIVKNESISYLRKDKKHENISDFEHTLSSSEDAYDHIIAKEDKNVIQNAIKRLGLKYQNVVKMYYFEELSYKQIGEKLDLSLNTVKTRIKRGRERLKTLLEK